MASTKQRANLPKDAAKGKHFGIVVSRSHEEISKALLTGATETLENLGAKTADITTVWVPGSFEIPYAAHLLAQHQTLDAILCPGVIIKGETQHDQYIAQEVAGGISQTGRHAGIPVVFGVLTTDTVEQAKARAGGAHGHKGIEAAETAVAMIDVTEQIKTGKKKSTGSVGFGINP
jgi:6,7-dimethyl-8-ribityllumazine synthase